MRRTLTLLVGILFVIGLLNMGCTRYAKEEQLQQLDQTEAAALAAEKTLISKNAEKSGWEKKVNQKQKELDAKKAEKAEVEKNLGK
ncbi:MAG: hypothetical protein H8E46_11220 [FCB group bacterium]|nr:hypothetical protein [FCB group bacterium]